MIEINEDRHNIEGEYKNHIFRYTFEKTARFDEPVKSLKLNCYFADNNYLYESKKQENIPCEYTITEIESLIETLIIEKKGWKFKKEKYDNFLTNDKVRPLSECEYLNVKIEDIPSLY